MNVWFSSLYISEKYLDSCYIIDSENSGLVFFERNFDGKTSASKEILSAENALWESMCVVELWFDSAWNK